MPGTLGDLLERIVRGVDSLSSRVEDLELIEFPPRVEGSGNGVAGRVAKWSDTKTITAAALIAPDSNVLTLAAGGAYTLTVNQTLTLTGASGKSLTLTTNLTNQGNNGVLNWGGAYTLTINATGTVTLGAGTLSASSVNDAGIADHTHAITASATPGASASLLKTTAAGLLTLSSLTVTTLTVGSKTLAMSANLTLDGVDGKTLTVNENLTLAGASGKSLTLTTNLTNSGGAGTLSWGGTYTLTIPATGTAALGAGTLTVSTTNDVTGTPHTHAITASAAPGAAAALLKTTAAGLLTLENLTVTGTVTAGDIAVDDMTINAGQIYNDASVATGITVLGDANADTTAKATTATGCVSLRAQKNGGSMGTNANLAVIRNDATTRFIFDAEGSAHANVEWITFDDYDDMGLLASLEKQISGDPIKAEFQRWMEYNREALERAKLVTFNPDGHNFINTTRLSMLLVGAVKQLAEKLDKLEKGSNYGIS